MQITIIFAKEREVKRVRERSWRPGEERHVAFSVDQSLHLEALLEPAGMRPAGRYSILYTADLNEGPNSENAWNTMGS